MTLNFREALQRDVDRGLNNHQLHEVQQEQVLDSCMWDGATLDLHTD